MSAKSRSVNFIATPEVWAFLGSLESGIKSKVINRALSQYMRSVDPDDVLAEAHEAIPKIGLLGLMEFAEWLEAREERKERTYSVGTNDGKTVRLAWLLKQFAKEQKKGRADQILARHDEQEDE